MAELALQRRRAGHARDGPVSLTINNEGLVMAHSPAIRRLRHLVVLTGILASVCLSLALSTSSASASPYCGGQWLTNYGICYGAERTMTGVSGYGLERSVCVGIAPISGRCSGGPRQIATFNWGSAIYSSPYIQDNAAGGTIVWGETF